MLEFFQSLFAPPRHMILLVISTWIGLLLAEKQAGQHKVESRDVNNLIFYGLIAFVLGGRGSFVLQNLRVFETSPLSIFTINPDVFDAMGGLTAASLTTLVYTNKRTLSIWPMLDALTPFFATVAIGLSLSRLAAGSAFGMETDQPWGIQMWNSLRHPTQVYDLFFFTFILVIVTRMRAHPRPGILFLVFTAMIATSELIVESFRAESIILLAGIRLEQIIAWLVLLFSFYLIELRYSKPFEK